MHSAHKQHIVTHTVGGRRLQRLEQLRESADEQELQLQEAGEVRDDVTSQQASLAERLQRCSQLQANLHERVSPAGYEPQLVAALSACC